MNDPTPTDEAAFKAREQAWARVDKLLGGMYDVKKDVDHLSDELYRRLVEPDDEDVDGALQTALSSVDELRDTLLRAHAHAFPEENDLRESVPSDFRAAHTINLGDLGRYKVVVGVNRSFAGTEWDVAIYRASSVMTRASNRKTGLILNQVMREVTYRQSGELYNERINDLVDTVLAEARTGTVQS